MSNLYLSNSEAEEDNESDLEIDNDLEAIKESECLESTHVEEEENNVDEQEWVDANDNDELLMTETNRGQKKAGYKGYYYTIDKKENLEGKTNWKCEITTIKKKGQVIQVGCKARLWTYNNGTSPVERHDHNHEPNPDLLTTYLLKQRIRELAKTTHSDPRTILKDILAVTILTEEEMAFLPNPDQIRRLILRVRSQQDNFGVNPKTAAELEVPDSLKNTLKSNEGFYWDDSGKHALDRVIIFTTAKNIVILNDIHE